MRAAVIQLQSTDDKGRNLEAAERLVRLAARDGADLAVLPEKFNLMGTPKQLEEGIEPLDGPAIEWARRLAGELGIWLVAGSIVEQGEDGAIYNTSALIDREGEIATSYRKVHMFDVEVGGVSYRESQLSRAGSEIKTAEIEGVKIGLAICYDLRFPEIFRIQALEGARIFCLPSAFTLHTGKDHWGPLLQARAIENQAFIVAAGQDGTYPKDHHHYGRSQIVDPWGVVLAQAADGESYAVAELDLKRQDEIRAGLPSLANRRPDVYRWPKGG